MLAVDLAVQKALDSLGNTTDANKAYLEFIKANFMIPIEHSSPTKDPEVLFLHDVGGSFLPVFTEKAYLDYWALEIASEINILELSGVDLLTGIGENVTVCLNIGSSVYKEFNPMEVARMRSIVAKLFKK